MQEWFTCTELAGSGIDGLPTTPKNVMLKADREGWRDPALEGVRWRRREGRGGGVEYHLTALPEGVRIDLTRWLRAKINAAAALVEVGVDLARDVAWAGFEKRSEKQRAKAKLRLDALQRAEDLVLAGIGRPAAAQISASQHGVAWQTLYRWWGLVAGTERQDRAAHLVARHAGSAKRAGCDDDAWEFIKADFLRPEKPSFTSCHARLLKVAAGKGWTVPSANTLRRWIEAVPREVRVNLRDGEQALKRLYPAQERDRGVFKALEAVNADGHQLDVFVRWEDGTIGRPMLLVFQDLFSGMILSWRACRSENKEVVRLAFGDLVEQWGVPEHCYLDNGRAFASKWISGGLPTRHRFKVQQDEVDGVMKTLGVQVHFVTPYSGQSKPIERAFLDVADRIAKDPRFAGAYTGRSTSTKPANYGDAAVPIDRLIQVVHEGIVEHNARPGRQTRACNGVLSFRQAFDASYATAVPKKATEVQRRLWLMAAETATVRGVDATITLERNRFHAPFLYQVAEPRRVQVRFDPQAMHQPLHVYALDGKYLGAAPCIEAVGFNNAKAAADHSAKRRAWMKATRALSAAERSMALADVAAALDAVAEAEPPAPANKVVRLITGSSAALATRPAAVEAEAEDDLLWLQRSNEQRRAGRGLHLVEPDEETDGDV